MRGEDGRDLYLDIVGSSPLISYKYNYCRQPGARFLFCAGWDRPDVLLLLCRLVGTKTGASCLQTLFFFLSIVCFFWDQLEGCIWMPRPCWQTEGALEPSHHRIELEDAEGC